MSSSRGTHGRILERRSEPIPTIDHHSSIGSITHIVATIFWRSIKIRALQFWGHYTPKCFFGTICYIPPPINTVRMLHSKYYDRSVYHDCWRHNIGTFCTMQEQFIFSSYRIRSEKLIDTFIVKWDEYYHNNVHKPNYIIKDQRPWQFRTGTKFAD